MFTLEIGGKPVAITDAGEDEAREIFEGKEFRDDLLDLESEDGPLWDGEAPLKWRAATEEEIAEFRQVELEEEDEEDEEDDGPVIMFLVPLVEDDEDEEYEED
ncbi:Hypothetical protein HVPorG_01334 [Roseomonas mucosa]|uniref:Uncharacterized protein n=1 Tax=Roseomonas mucosa TaxID=207340 RepID=A0A1S8D636_9PROT|nr:MULTISPECIES: hypothetical protein [Roseomonas]MBS5904952.1 hypothetical protein [Acetobacteraceae bacterium]MDT8267340.1 hypothetical protein [Roseomonas sp. DSM 102946]ATR20743.1 hypothetical protein CTJ15_10820 [Roseomonas sp. FDAARGOS_362]AWV22734.1 Hypothetical protein RADP37_01334 [Roseomonas mucosa]MCG7353693.1 hypothetical protein [Roseomonas mucosa]